MFKWMTSSTTKPEVITVTRKGVVRYMFRTLIVKENGMMKYKIKNVNSLQVYNKIEGHLKFTGSSKPRQR